MPDSGGFDENVCFATLFHDLEFGNVGEPVRDDDGDDVGA